MPRLTKNYTLNFYGGEPLLSFDLIKRTLAFLKKKNNEFGKKCSYSITTNGSLITNEIIQLFADYEFSVELSFDGLVQDIQRQKGSFGRIVSLVHELLSSSRIDLEINSVFTPGTVGCITESIQFLVSLGVGNIHLAVSTLEPWSSASLREFKKELTKSGTFLVDHYKKRGNIPLVNFREDHQNGFFFCAAGKDRLAVTPEGGIWGCWFFPDYFKGKENSPEYQQFFFGKIDDFIKNYQGAYHKVYANYAQLSMDNYSTPTMRCFLCTELEKCAVCPVNAAFYSAALGKIPRHLCEIKKITIHAKEEFRRALNKLNSELLE